MRTQVQVEQAADGYRLRLTESQHWLVTNTLAAFMEGVASPAEVELVLGPAGGGLGAVLSRAEPAETGSRLVVEASPDEAHALHALLVSTPARFSTEEAFHDRVGAFRENLLNMATGLGEAVRKLGDGAGGLGGDPGDPGGPAGPGGPA
jgi:hypothetical protein